MIINLQRFLEQEQHYWQELEVILKRLSDDPGCQMNVAEVRRFHYLYERTSADLVKINTFASEPQLRQYLETLISQAYGEIHEIRTKPFRLAPLQWFFQTVPRTFRRHAKAFALALMITLLGAGFGAGVAALDPAAKALLLPFPHLQGDPSERVAMEEKTDRPGAAAARSTFAAQLMTHNTKVAILAMALGITWGLGTMLLLFYNGIILGAVCMDYVLAGEIAFLAAWLLPHGAVEIPAILLAGQAGLVLASALIGWETQVTLRRRLRCIGPDLVTLMAALAILLIWAGFVESFLSQYHEPVIPYFLKITFGLIELLLLLLYLGYSGQRSNDAGQERVPETARWQ